MFGSSGSSGRHNDFTHYRESERNVYCFNNCSYRGYVLYMDTAWRLNRQFNNDFDHDNRKYGRNIRGRYN